MSFERDDAERRARAAITDLARATCDCLYETERELAQEIDHAHELLTDAGIPHVYPQDGVLIGLAVRVGLLIDESNSVRAELNEIIDQFTGQ